MIQYAKKLSKSLAVALTLLLGTLTANAGATFTVSKLVIQENGYATAYVNMENDEPVWNIQFDITLPEGLAFNGYNAYAEYRLSQAGYQVFGDKVNDKTIRIAALAPGLTGIEAGTGNIVRFSVKYEDEIAEDAVITIGGVEATTTTGTAIDADTEDGEVVVNDDINIGSSNYIANARIGFFTNTWSSSTNISVNEGSTHEIEVNLTHDDVNMWGIQGTITLPEGMSLEGNLVPTDRLGHFNLSTIKVSDRVYNFMATTLATSDPDAAHIVGNSGTIIFSFTVKTTGVVKDGARIYIHNMKTVVKNGGVNQSEPIRGGYINIYSNRESNYNNMVWLANQLQSQLDNVESYIEQNDPADVAEELLEVAEGIQEAIDEFRADIDEAYEAGTLDEEVFRARYDELSEEIAALLEDAQKYAVDEDELHYLYEKFLFELNTEQNKLDATLEEIAKNYPEIKDDEDLVAAAEEIQDEIDALIAELEELYETKHLTAEFDTEKDALEAAINALLEQAKELYENYTDSPVRGDVNADKEVDLDDLDLFITALLNAQLPEAGTDDFIRYDANADQEIDIVDAMAILNLYVWGDIYGEPAAARLSGNGSNTLSIAASGQQYDVQLQNATAFAAFQFDVELPQGTQLAAATLAERAQGLVLRTSQQGNRVRVVAYPTAASQLQGAEGTVVSLSLVGQGEPQFQNIVFATPTAEGTHFTVGGTTGISAIGAAARQGAVYSLDGRQLQGLQKGLNVVRTSEGAVKVLR